MSEPRHQGRAGQAGRQQAPSGQRVGGWTGRRGYLEIMLMLNKRRLGKIAGSEKREKGVRSDDNNNPDKRGR